MVLTILDVINSPFKIHSDTLMTLIFDPIASLNNGVNPKKIIIDSVIHAISRIVLFFSMFLILFLIDFL